MDISDRLACLYSARGDEQDGNFVVKVASSKVPAGDLDPGSVVRVALLSTGTEEKQEEQSTGQEWEQQPPVKQGEQRTVDIEDIGEKGDGIARVERGYVVIVPETKSENA